MNRPSLYLLYNEQIVIIEQFYNSDCSHLTLTEMSNVISENSSRFVEAVF